MIYFLKIWYKINQYPHLICKQYNTLRIMNTATSSWRENVLRYFFSGHYMVSIPIAKFNANCKPRGTDYVRGQISEHFHVNWRLLCSVSSKYYDCIRCVSCSLFSVHWYDFTSKRMFLSLMSNKILKKQFFL